jgi:hypothetical protein
MAEIRDGIFLSGKGTYKFVADKANQEENMLSNSCILLNIIRHKTTVMGKV